MSIEINVCLVVSHFIFFLITTICKLVSYLYKAKFLTSEPQSFSSVGRSKLLESGKGGGGGGGGGGGREGWSG